MGCLKPALGHVCGWVVLYVPHSVSIWGGRPGEGGWQFRGALRGEVGTV